MSEALPGSAITHRIRFTHNAAPGEPVLVRFHDPAPAAALLLPDHGDSRDTDLLLLVVEEFPDKPAPREAGEENGTDRPLPVKFRGGELLWQRHHGTLRCGAGQGESLLPAIAEFALYERELKRLEDEIAAAWPSVEHDRRIAFQATAADLRQSDVLGQRMSEAFGRRIRFARLEPHLHTTDAARTVSARSLADALREAAGVEARAEAVDAQMEVAEHIYEMSSQRLGEFRASHGEHIMELIIIALLAAETLVMLVQTFSRTR